jgi:hypothetical protein
MISAHSLRKHVGAASAVLCIALMPALAQAAGPMVTAGSSDVGAFAAGGTVGFQTGNSLTQFRLTGEGQYGLLMLQPQLELDLAGHLGLLVGDSVTTFEIVPEARIRYLVDRKLSLYGDAGLGIAFASVSVGPASASQTWGLLRFAGGVQYKITPQVILLGEPIGLNLYFGTGSGFQYGLAAGALYRF